MFGLDFDSSVEMNVVCCCGVARNTRMDEVSNSIVEAYDLPKPFPCDNYLQVCLISLVVVVAEVVVALLISHCFKMCVCVCVCVNLKDQVVVVGRIALEERGDGRELTLQSFHANTSAHCLLSLDHVQSFSIFAGQVRIASQYIAHKY
jgi:hypothetical protein